jgi:hypothetical protein
MFFIDCNVESALPTRSKMNVFLIRTVLLIKIMIWQAKIFSLVSAQQ